MVTTCKAWTPYELLWCVCPNWIYENWILGDPPVCSKVCICNCLFNMDEPHTSQLTWQCDNLRCACSRETSANTSPHHGSMHTTWSTTMDFAYAKENTFKKSTFQVAQASLGFSCVWPCSLVSNIIPKYTWFSTNIRKQGSSILWNTTYKATTT